jgi:DNA-binding response OmpR family regulator
MTRSELDSAATTLDPIAIAFYLRVPRSHVVLLQAYFELYDGVATVRTLQGSDQVVCVLTTQSQRQDCIQVLEAIRGEVHWEIAKEVPHDELTDKLDTV